MAAEPSEGFAPYATAYIEFYDSDVCVKIENRELAGRQRVFDALLSLLTYVESGFGRTGTRRHPVRLLHESLGANETHESVWQLQLDDLSGATRRVVWRSTREWKNGRVIREVIRNSIERVYAMGNISQDTTVALLQRFSPFASMLFFAPTDNLTPQTVMFNGTAAFVDTGKNKLVLTNSHVYRRFKELKSKTPNLAMFLTGSHQKHVLELKESYLVDDGGNAVDLAVFAFDRPEQVGMIGKSYFRAATWPPVRPTAETTAVVIGFVGEHRQVAKDSLKINLSVICDKVTSVSDRHFVLVDGEKARTSVKVNPTLGELGDLGGMSGSPAFAVGLDGEPSFAGLLYEADEGKDATVFALHADLLTADGKIDWNRVSWR